VVEEQRRPGVELSDGSHLAVGGEVDRVERLGHAMGAHDFAMQVSSPGGGVEPTAGLSSATSPEGGAAVQCDRRTRVA